MKAQPDDGIDELWFRFGPSKFMAGIRGLNANEVKVYICLLCRMYERGGPLRNDDEILATYCEMRPSSFAKARDRLIRLEKLFLTDDGRIFNATAAREIAWRASKSENSKRAGKISAEKRQQNQWPNATDAQPPLNHIEEEIYIGGGNACAREADETRTDRERLLAAMGLPSDGLTPAGRIFGNSADMLEARRWADELHIPFDLQIAAIGEVMSRKTDGAPASFKYFTPVMQRLAADLARPRLQPVEGGQDDRRHARGDVAAELQRSIERAAAGGKVVAGW